MKTVVSLYDNIEDARDVVEDLVDAGLNREDISLVARDVEGQYGTYLEEGYAESEGEEVGEAAAGGAVGGAVVGGLTGILVGLGAFAIPGIGPVIAAGPLAAGLTGAAVGAVTGGVLSALVEWGIPEEEAGYYAESVRRGSTLVAARVTDERVDDVVEMMEDYDPVDIERRAAYWRSEEDWTGYSADVDPYGPEEIAAYRERSLSWEQDWGDDQMETDHYRTGMYESIQPDYRTHYDSQFVNSGYSYSQFLPAYRYGHDIRMDPRYSGRTWEQIEMDARRGWEDYNEGTWEDFKDAVRHGWEEAKRAIS